MKKLARTPRREGAAAGAPVRLRMLVLAAACLSACSTVPPSSVNANAQLTPTSRVSRDLAGLPKPRRKVAVAVYGFRDQTGQYKPSPDSSYSTSVTQGAAAMLIKALKDSGWYMPVERESLQNLLTERKIVRALESPTDKGKPLVNLPNLLPASLIIEGGVIAYESNVRTGGKGANYLGLGASTQYRVDQVTVSLRSVDIRNGQVLDVVSVTKTIYSYQFSASVYKFTSYQSLLQGETGYTTNEPAQLAVREAIEAAVVHLTAMGVRDRYLELRDPQEFFAPVIQNYLKEGRDGLADERPDVDEESDEDPVLMNFNGEGGSAMAPVSDLTGDGPAPRAPARPAMPVALAAPAKPTAAPTLPAATKPVAAGAAPAPGGAPVKSLVAAPEAVAAAPSPAAAAKPVAAAKAPAAKTPAAAPVAMPVAAAEPVAAVPAPVVALKPAAVAKAPVATPVAAPVAVPEAVAVAPAQVAAAKPTPIVKAPVAAPVVASEPLVAAPAPVVAAKPATAAKAPAVAPEAVAAAPALAVADKRPPPPPVGAVSGVFSGPGLARPVAAQPAPAQPATAPVAAKPAAVAASSAAKPVAAAGAKSAAAKDTATATEAERWSPPKSVIPPTMKASDDIFRQYWKMQEATGEGEPK